MNNIVLGAGPVGQIMAIALFKANQKVILIGQKPKRLPHMAFAIHPKNISFLNSLNIRPPSQAIYSMTLDTQKPTTLRSNTPLCYIIKYNDLLDTLSTQLPLIPLKKTFPTKLLYNKLLFTDSTLPFKQLIACDGQSSWSRQQLNIETTEYDYQQYAHTCIITHTQPQQGIHQTFRSYGTFAKLTLPNPYQTAMIWSVDHEVHQLILKNGLKDTLKNYNLYPNNVLFLEHHNYQKIIASLAKQYFHNHVLFAGNSLHSIHPLAGTGFNLAIGDIQAALEIIAGDLPSIAYASLRKKPHIKAHWLTDLIARSRHCPALYPPISSLSSYLLGTKSVKNHIINQIQDTH